VFCAVQSTDNMEMLTRLQSEQHIAKELAARLGQQEDELKDTREQVSGWNNAEYCVKCKVYLLDDAKNNPLFILS